MMSDCFRDDADYAGRQRLRHAIFSLRFSFLSRLMMPPFLRLRQPCSWLSLSPPRHYCHAYSFVLIRLSDWLPRFRRFTPLIIFASFQLIAIIFISFSRWCYAVIIAITLLRHFRHFAVFIVSPFRRFSRFAIIFIIAMPLIFSFQLPEICRRYLERHAIIFADIAFRLSYAVIFSFGRIRHYYWCRWFSPDAFFSSMPLLRHFFSFSLSLHYFIITDLFCFSLPFFSLADYFTSSFRLRQRHYAIWAYASIIFLRYWSLSLFTRWFSFAISILLADIDFTPSFSSAAFFRFRFAFAFITIAIYRHYFFAVIIAIIITPLPLLITPPHAAFIFFHFIISILITTLFLFAAITPFFWLRFMPPFPIDFHWFRHIIAAFDAAMPRHIFIISPYFLCHAFSLHFRFAIADCAMFIDAIAAFAFDFLSISYYFTRRHYDYVIIIFRLRHAITPYCAFTIFIFHIAYFHAAIHYAAIAYSPAAPLFSLMLIFASFHFLWYFIIFARHSRLSFFFGFISPLITPPLGFAISPFSFRRHYRRHTLDTPFRFRRLIIIYAAIGFHFDYYIIIDSLFSLILIFAVDCFLFRHAFAISPFSIIFFLHFFSFRRFHFAIVMPPLILFSRRFFLSLRRRHFTPFFIAFCRYFRFRHAFIITFSFFHYFRSIIIFASFSSISPYFDTPFIDISFFLSCCFFRYHMFFVFSCRWRHFFQPLIASPHFRHFRFDTPPPLFSNIFAVFLFRCHIHIFDIFFAITLPLIAFRLQLSFLSYWWLR